MQQEVELGACLLSNSSDQMSSLNAERASDLLSCTGSVLVHSGNVASWSKLRRKGVLTPTAEVTSYWPVGDLTPESVR